MILLEKLAAITLFAFANFVIPFGATWLKSLILSLPGLLVIDILYGRVVIYSVAAVLFKLHLRRSIFLETGIYFFSLIFSLGVVIAVTGQVQIFLFHGKNPWNCMAYYLISTAGVVAGVAVWLAKRRVACTSSEPVSQP